MRKLLFSCRVNAETAPHGDEDLRRAAAELLGARFPRPREPVPRHREAVGFLS